jgi:putative hydrolase of the HAD superfamily
VIKAIVFDCFGVLTTDGWEPFCLKYLANSNKLKIANKLVDDLNLGLVNYDDFLESVSSLAGVPVEKATKYIDDNKTNKQLFGLIKILKTKYKIGMLSNSGADWLDELFSKEEIDMFDDIILSCKVGLTKPDPRIFNLCVKRLNVLPSEAVFIDDSVKYCNAAQNVGFKVINYVGFEDIKSRLGKILTV